MNFRRIFLCWALFLCPLAINAQEFDQDQFNDLKDLVQDLTTRYPVNEYYYVGLGRSPTPIIAFLQSVSPSLASNVPLSNFKYSAENTYLREKRIRDEKYRPESHLPLDTEGEAILNDMLKERFPSAEVIGGKKILLIDYVDSGEGLVAGAHYINKFLESQGRKETVVPLALTLPYFQPQETPKYLKELKIRTFNISPYPEIAGNMGIKQNYDTYGQYGSFDIKKHKVGDIVENEKYKELVAKMSHEYWPSCQVDPVDVVHVNEELLLENFIQVAQSIHKWQQDHSQDL